MKITYFHRSKDSGFSIHKVTQAVLKYIPDKEEYYVPNKGAGIKDILGNLLYVYKHRNKNGINHITGDIHYCILVLIGCKTVITFHDAVGLEFKRNSFLKDLFFRYLWYKIPLKLTDRAICISNRTKESIDKIVKRDDTVVIYDSIDRAEYQEIEEKTENPSIHHPVRILLIGTKENKNIERTFQALKGIQCVLTIVGKLSDKQKSLLNECDIKYINKYNLSDKEIIEEYCSCDIVSFCSLYEGFGMPVLEANITKKPIICSNIPVLKEVAGESAFFVDPNKTEEIKKAFQTLISSERIRNQLIESGIKNVEKFYSERIASEWIEVYNKLNVRQ